MTTDQSLNQLLSRRAWYKGSGINENTARVYKKRFLENSMELETRIKILRAAGFRLVQEMEWEENFDPGQIRNELSSKLHRMIAFWSYEPSRIKQISDDVLIEKVLVHLDIEDIRHLFLLFPKKEIKRVWKEKMLRQEPDLHGLNRLYAFLFFDIKDPDRYIRNYKSKWNKKLNERIS
jgi:hypothetical protein